MTNLKEKWEENIQIIGKANAGEGFIWIDRYMTHVTSQNTYVLEKSSKKTTSNQKTKKQVFSKNEQNNVQFEERIILMRFTFS